MEARIRQVLTGVLAQMGYDWAGRVTRPVDQALEYHSAVSQLPPVINRPLRSRASLSPAYIHALLRR